VRVIGVIDLRGGQAVRARAGARDDYAPLGDAVELARSYVARHGLSELYVADLDAIAGGPERPAPRTVGPALRTICGLASGWVDAGVSSADLARDALDLGAAHVVVGLETLPSFAVLQDICAAIGGQRVAFSLDLRGGEPIGIAQSEAAHIVAARAADAGVGAIIVLDLARVGMKVGIDLELIALVRKAAPNVTLLAGGGVRGPDDLARLADAGVDGALVATALQDGSLDGIVAALQGPPYRTMR